MKKFNPKMLRAAQRKYAEDQAREGKIRIHKVSATEWLIERLDENCPGNMECRGSDMP